MSRFGSQLGAALRLFGSASVLCVVAASAAVAQQDTPGSRTIADYVPVTDEYLQNPNPEDWMMMRGNYEMWGYSELDQINRDNVGQLSLVWARAMGQDGANQGAPLVYNGIMFLPNPWDHVQAIDAASGDLIWEYERPRLDASWADGPLRSTWGQRQRSVFLYEDKLIMITSDNIVVALDATNGQVIWENDRGGEGFATNTSGPIVVNGIVLAGSNCQVAPFGCYVTGHDVETGEELWRNEVIPRPGEPGDETWAGTPFESRWCTGVWGQLAYDPQLDILHYGSTGICPASETQRNAAGATMAGTNERWAVRPETGEVLWRHQVLPRDNWDQECTFEMMIIDTVVNPNPEAQAMYAYNPNVAGETRRTLTGMPCKTPVFWSFDAETGEFLYAKATWDDAENIYDTIDETGHVTVNEEIVLTNVGEEYFFCPTFGGGRDWPSGAYDPTRNVMFQPTIDRCTRITARADREATPEFAYNTTNVGVQNPFKDNDNLGRIDAVDVETGDTVWTWETRAGNYSPVLATAGDLLFNSGGDRYFRAHDVDTGDVIWQTRLGSGGSGHTVTYSVDGRQYVAIVAGAAAGAGALHPEIDSVGAANMVYVFALPE